MKNPICKGMWYYEVQILMFVFMWQHDMRHRPESSAKNGIRLGRLYIWRDLDWKPFKRLLRKWDRFVYELSENEQIQRFALRIVIWYMDVLPGDWCNKAKNIPVGLWTAYCSYIEAERVAPIYFYVIPERRVTVMFGQDLRAAVRYAKNTPYKHGYATIYASTDDCMIWDTLTARPPEVRRLGSYSHGFRV